MSSTDFHLRRVIELAAAQRSHKLVDDAFAIIDGHFDRFGSGGSLAPELPVLFAEVASSLKERESEVSRALELYDRLHCEEDQFKVRALLVRCVYEARLGTDTFRLKGSHLLQQLKYALDFVTQALSIATKPQNSDKYGFLVYNASLVFWDCVRPMCRLGWQRHVIQETTAILEALKVVSGRGGGGKGGGAPGGAIPVTLDMTAWLVEISLNLAFGLEDADKNADAQKMAESAVALVEEAKNDALKMLVLSARAHLARKAPGKVKEDIDKASGSATLGTALFACNGGIPKEKSEDELIACWKAVDAEFDLREARDSYDPKEHHKTGGFAKDGGASRNIKPQKLIELAVALRAACQTGNWAVAQPMLARLDKFPMPAGRGRILLDLAKAEVDVWQTCNLKHADPITGMLLTAEVQSQREVEGRHRAVRLCEQCLTTARRINEVDLVEESAVTMWNVGRELLCAEHRSKAHKSLQRCAEILEEVQSASLVQLRVQMHFEVACCEVASDLLTKGRQELHKAKSIDCTLADSQLSDAMRTQIGEGDPAPYVRRFDVAIDHQLHLLHWKLNVYEEPSDPADQVMLLLDQVQKQSNSSGKLAYNLLVQGFTKLEGALEELVGEQLQAFSDTFEPPSRILASSVPLKPLPEHAPATVREGGAGAEKITQLVAQPIHDQQPKSSREKAVIKIKRIVALMCRIGLQAHRVNEPEFAVKACSRALEIDDVSFGPPPVELEGALLLAEAAYTKAACLSKKLEEMGVINGVDDELVEETPPEPADPVVDDDADDEEDGENAPLSQEEKAEAVRMKKELMQALLDGMEKSHEFGQGWMVANGLAQWWNLHLDIVKLSHSDPSWLSKTLEEYRSGLKTLQKFFYGPAALPTEDFNDQLVGGLVLAHLDVSVEAGGDLSVLGDDQLLVLKRLNAHQRKEVVARVTELCKKKEKPPPDLLKLRPERLEAAASAGGKDAKKPPPDPKKGGGAPEAPSPDLQGYEADVMMAMVSIPYAKDTPSASALVDQAVGLLNKWEPNPADEVALTLCVELWTRLGRACLKEPMHPNDGAKRALMCIIRVLGKVDAPIPRHASRERLLWRGACHALCGDVFVRLVDPQKQEKESILKLRHMSVEQYERCCEYAIDTQSDDLAASGATRLWNAALPMLHSADTRQLLIEPLHKATQALGAVKFTEDPFFFVGLYAALFDCYSDMQNWDKIHEMLDEAFPVIPPSSQRRLWALRMLALSKQGKNVFMAMGKMKESQAKAQAGIWLVLAGAASKASDQMDAYTKAIDILQAAEQPEVVEVRMQFADWMLRNGFDPSDADQQLTLGADLFLMVEEQSEDESEPEEENDVDDEHGDGGSVAASSMDGSIAPSRISAGGSKAGGSRAGGSESGSQAPSRAASRSRKRHSDGKSAAGGSRAGGSRAGGSRAGSRAGSRMSKGSKMSKARSSAAKSALKRTSSKMSSSGSSASAKSKLKAKKAEEDEELPEILYSHNYEVLSRIFSMKGRLAAGPDLHQSLLASVHFVVKFFSSTLDVANQTAQKLASIPPEQKPPEGQQDTGGAGAKPAKTLVEGKTKLEPVELMPSFVLPAQLTDWANEESWSWVTSPALPMLLKRSLELGIVFDSSATYVGHADVFARPAISFHAQVRLLDDLEEHHYQLWTFPVIALQLQLAKAFEQQPITDAITCVAYMRFSRLASECRLEGPAAKAREKWVDMLQAIPTTFGDFVEEREHARNQRAGRKKQGSDSLDPDWLDAAIGGRAEGKVSAPWTCSELHAYQVWAVLSKECLKHGELWMASTLAEEAVEHATDHGDRRTLRELRITKAWLAQEEGRDIEVVRTLKDITAVEPAQSVEVALMLASAYRRNRQPSQAEEALADARKAVAAAANRLRSGAPDDTCTRHVMMERMIWTVQLRAEVARLDSAPVASKAWLADLDAALAAHSAITQKLLEGAFYRRCVEACCEFVEAVLRMLEGKQQDLVRDPANSGILTFGVLVERTQALCNCIAACQPASEAMVRRALPIEGAEGHVVVPAEVLAADLDVIEARSQAVLRRFRERQAQHAKRMAAIGKAAKMGAGTPGGAFSGVGGVSKASPVQPEPELGEKVDAWLEDAAGKISHTENVMTVARELHQVEASIASVSNAVTVLQLAGPSQAAAEEEGFPIPACRVRALAELGCLQLELARRSSPEAFAKKWDSPDADLTEVKSMQVAERLSNVLNNKDPAALFNAPKPEPTAAEGEVPGEDAEPDAEPDLPFQEIAKATLCEAARVALQSRRFGPAKRALEVLALEAYGQTCPQAAVEFLFWLQSVNVSMLAEEIFDELLPPDHHERVQRHMLRRMEEVWPTPDSLTAYQSMLKRLERESPLFQRLRLDELPPISDLLLTRVPPNTLVVTLQVHNHYLYVGAASTPPAGEREQRLPQLQHTALRIEVPEHELYGCVHKLKDLSLNLEKELITAVELDAKLADEYERVAQEVEAFLMVPLAEELATHFWPNSTHGEHPLNPKQLMLLPDRLLWGLPFERMASLLNLFGGVGNSSALARDLSLHLMAQRPGPSDPAAAAAVPPRPASTVLLTDAFNEDTLRASDNPKAETMGLMHERLVTNKVISGGEKSLHGGRLTASPGDVKGMLADSTIFVALGFGRFNATLPSVPFAAQDLRHLKLLALFHRAVNDRAFRRQTKTDSAKTIRQISFEDNYCTPLIAAYRGVQCMLQTTGPSPANLMIQATETFSKALQAGKTAAKALEEVLLLQVESPELRYQRILSGGATPPPASGPDKQDLFPFHTKMVMHTVGPPWSPLEGGEVPGGKKK